MFSQSLRRLLYLDAALEDNVTVCGHNLFEEDKWLLAIYLVSALLFVMSLRGLSKHETARWGNYYGLHLHPCLNGHHPRLRLHPPPLPQ